MTGLGGSRRATWPGRWASCYRRVAWSCQRRHRPLKGQERRSGAAAETTWARQCRDAAAEGQREAATVTAAAAGPATSCGVWRRRGLRRTAQRAGRVQRPLQVLRWRAGSAGAGLAETECPRWVCAGAALPAQQMAILKNAVVIGLGSQAEGHASEPVSAGKHSRCHQQSVQGIPGADSCAPLTTGACSCTSLQGGQLTGQRDATHTIGPKPSSPCKRSSLDFFMNHHLYPSLMQARM